MVALRMHARAHTQFASGLVNNFPFRVDTSALYSAEENAKYFLMWCNGDSEQSWGGGKLNDLRLRSNWSKGAWRCESRWSQGCAASAPAPALPREPRRERRRRERALPDTLPASAAGKHIQCPARLTPCLSNLFCHLSLPNVSLFCLSHWVCRSFDSLHN